MNYIHYTRKFTDKISNEPNEAGIINKLEDLRFIDKLENYKPIDKYPRGILVLKSTGIYLCRIIIQPQQVEVNEKKLNVLFIRDYISKRSFDYFWGNVTYPQLLNGNWVTSNPIPSEEIEEFKINFFKSLSAEAITIQPIPDELSTWLHNFKMKLNFDIYEREAWVTYANDRTNNGLIQKYELYFRDLLKALINLKLDNNYVVEVINEEAGIKSIISEESNVGVIINDFPNIDGTRVILLHNGAHIKIQHERWKEAIEIAKKKESKVSADLLNITKDAHRAYPSWIINNNDDELWSAIERNEGFHNLSLLPEQISFLNNIMLPSYINGQAGSGKSTMLYYLFTNIIFFKYSNEFNGEIIFLTENNKLIETTKKSIIGLLTNNPAWAKLLTIEQIAEVGKFFKSFKDFLLKIIPDDIQSDFEENCYLDFPKFKQLYNNRKELLRKYSAEEVWYTITTYIYGYYEEEIVDSVEKYENIPSKFRIMDSSRFKDIVDLTLPFYNKLIGEGYWDKVKLVRYIWNLYHNNLPKKYCVVFCDEAQDFSRIELRLILRSSEYTKYDLERAEKVPIVLAGDALQTVSPTGFSDIRLHQMLWELFQEVNFTYDKTRSTYRPEYNYRSVQSIVNLANIIQTYRKDSLEEESTIKQTAKRSVKINQPPIIYSKEWLIKPENIVLFENKFKYKSFIIPVDLNEEENYLTDEKLLYGKFEDIKSSIDAKGAEYSQVVVYGFGDQFNKEFGRLNWNKSESNFQNKFFFNKLYVAITRAQNELIIIDSQHGIENFWRPLIQEVINTKSKQLSFQTEEDILLISPETGLDLIESSTSEDAYANALRDMEQGITDSNSARLIVASNVFLMIGDIEKANECLGYKEQIKNNWATSGNYFIKAKRLERASHCYFQGKYWEKVYDISKELSGNNQLARTIICNLMTNNFLNKDELKKLYEIRGNLNDILRNIIWYEDYSKKIFSFADSLVNNESKRDLAYILENTVKDNDFVLWHLIGKLYFDTKQFDFAIKSWNRVLNSDAKIDFYPLYIQAHIEKAKDEKEILDEILWTGRLMMENISNGDRASLASRIKSLFNNKFEILNTSLIKEELYLHIYHSVIVNGDITDLVNIGKLTEQNYVDQNSLVSKYYTSFIRNSNSEDICMYLKERWIKLKYKQLSSTKNISNSEIINELNQIFIEHSFPFPDSNFPITFDEIKEISDLPTAISSKPSEHFKSIHLLNFRKFKEISIRNLGQFNLVLGDNNTGKTTLLEALLFSSNANECLTNFIYILKQRNSNFDKTSNSQVLNLLATHGEEKDRIKYSFKHGRRFWSFILRHPNAKELLDKIETADVDNRQYLGIESNNVIFDISERVDNISNDLLKTEIINKIPYVPFGKGFYERIASLYLTEINTRQLTNSFLTQMKLFIPNIVGIQADTENNLIFIEEEVNGKDYKYLLNDFGEGANKLFRILLQLHASQGKRLMIDEIDAGIHYSRFSEFWKIILRTAKDYNVQLFATSHNEECIKYFWEVLQENGWEGLAENDIQYYRNASRIITLEKHTQTEQIIPIVRDYESMLYAYEHHLEVRGQR